MAAKELNQHELYEALAGAAVQPRALLLELHKNRIRGHEHSVRGSGRSVQHRIQPGGAPPGEESGGDTH